VEKVPPFTPVENLTVGVTVVNVTATKCFSEQTMVGDSPSPPLSAFVDIPKSAKNFLKWPTTTGRLSLCRWPIPKRKY
jgi:hypothetical protein